MFIVSTNELKNGLTKARKFVPSHSSLPVLSYVLVEAKDDTLTIVSTDLQTRLEQKLHVVVKSECTFAAHAKTLYELVSKTPDDELTVKYNEKKMEISITSDTMKAKLKCEDAEQFPQPMESDVVQEVFVDTEQLKHAVLQVAPSAAKDESRLMLTGMHIASTDSGVIFVTADGFRMTVFENLGLDIDKVDILVGAYAFRDVVRMLDNDKETALRVQDKRIGVKQDDLFAEVLVIELGFPDHTQISNYKKDNVLVSAKVAVDELKDALKVASTMAGSGQATPMVKLSSLNNSQMMLSAYASQFGESEAFFSANVTGDEMTVAFQPTYLGEFLNNCKEEFVTLDFLGENQPLHIHYNNGMVKCQHIIMPLHVET